MEEMLLPGGTHAKSDNLGSRNCRPSSGVNVELECVAVYFYFGIYLNLHVCVNILILNQLPYPSALGELYFFIQNDVASLILSNV
jgi:hypothetical protein